MILRPLLFTLFPYTTLFRSRSAGKLRALVLRSGSEAGWVNYLTRFVPLNLQAHPSPQPSPLRKGRGGIVSRFLAIQASWERVHCRPSQGEGRDGGTELTPFPRCQES